MILCRSLTLFALAATFSAPLLHAHLAQAQAEPGDPPSRVARVALLQGNVSLEPSGVDTFSAAELNYPLTIGDRIYADNSALTELQTGGLALRLGNGADLTITSLTGGVAQFGLAQGSLRLRTRDLLADDGSPATVEIDTANGAIVIEQPGDIRVDSYPQDDTTVVTVTTGAVEISGNGFDTTLGPNQALRLAGNPAFAEAVQVLPPDTLDRFDARREYDRQRALQVSAAYVDPGIIGVADLAAYGDWVPNASGPEGSGNADDLGAVWFPRNVPADWVPYRNGRWAWVAPWGWTWVEAEPWGFAPFHYGRWSAFGPPESPRWGWIPGPPPSVFAGNRPIRPVYSPALVAFVGGPGFSVSVGFGGGPGAGVTAWFPLGPREVFTPWYHASPGYVNRVNVTNIYTRNAVEVHNTYINRTTVVYNTTVNNYTNRDRATVAVSQRDFAAGRSVAASQPLQFNPAERQQLNRAPILPHPLVSPAATIAAPPMPARIVPPNPERPVLETRRGLVTTGSAPANGNPVHPTAGAPQPLNPPNNAQTNAYPGRNPATTQGNGRNQPAAPAAPAYAGTPAIPVSGSTYKNAYDPGPGSPQRGAYPDQRSASPDQHGAYPDQRGAYPDQRIHPPLTVLPGTTPPTGPGRAASPSLATPSHQPPSQVANPQPPPALTPPAQQTPNRGRPGMPAAQQIAPPAQTVQARPLPRPTDQPRALVTRTEPQTPQPTFVQQQRAIERNDPGRPLGPGQVENLRNNRPAGPPQQAEPVAHPPAAAPPRPPAPAKPAAPGTRPEASGTKPDPRQKQPQ